jgi:uncharacterized membrane protein
MGKFASVIWMSLVPLVIRWIDEAGLEALPIAAYGIVLAMATVSYVLLEGTIIAANGRDSKLAKAIGHELKGKLSLVMYVVAAASALLHQWIALALYVVTALMWFMPDRRIESLEKS